MWQLVHSRPLHSVESKGLGGLVASGNLEQLKIFLRQKRTKVQDWIEVETFRTLLHEAASSKRATLIPFLTSNAAAVWINAKDKDGNTALHVAVTNGNLEAVRLLIRSNIDASIQNTNFESALHVAIKQGLKATAIVETLVEYSTVPFLEGDNYKENLLHFAAKNKNLEAFKLIHVKLQKDCSGFVGDKWLAKDSCGTSVIHVAARYGAQSIIEYLLSCCMDHGFSSQDFLHTVSHDQKYPLHFAVEGNHMESVQCMLQYGADCTKRSNNNFPPVHTACSQDQLAMLKAMVDIQGRVVLKALANDGKTLLHSSMCSICSRGLIHYLLQNGLGIDEKDSEGLTPLANAIILGNAEATEILLRQGANPFIKNAKGFNALFLAISRKKLEIFKKLVALDCARDLVEDTNNTGTCPFHYAIEHGLTDMVEPLLRRVEKISKDGAGNNYLHLAAISCSLKTLMLVLSLPVSKSMVNEPNEVGFTPLHYAAAGNSLAVVQNLLNHGAMSHRSNTGQTPLMLACRSGNLEIAQLLLADNVFQKNWTDFEGNSALHMAVEGRNPQVLVYCLDEEMLVKRNTEGLTFFDLILQKAEKKLATTAVNHNRWAEYVTPVEIHETHPLLCLIESIPEAYQIVLDQCFTSASCEATHVDYWEEYNFAAINTAPQEITSKLIKNRHEHYLMHPVITAFVNSKWKGAGLCYYYGRMFFFFLTAVLSTSLAITDPFLGHNISANGTCFPSNMSRGFSVLLYLTIFASWINLAYNILHGFIYRHLLFPYLTTNILPWASLVATICINVYGFSVIAGRPNCPLTLASALGVCFAWLSTGFSMRLIRFGNIGINITIVMTTTRSVFAILSIMSVFIMALGIPMYILAGSSDVYYNSVGISLFSTLGYLVGLSDYEEIIANEVNGQLRFSAAVFLLLLAIMVMLPIVLINVMLGLVLGDITRTLEDAEITQRIFEFNCLNCIENFALIHKVFPHLSKSRLRVYPNRRNCVGKVIAYFTNIHCRANARRSSNQIQTTSTKDNEIEQGKHSGQTFKQLQDILEGQNQQLKKLEMLISEHLVNNSTGNTNEINQGD